MGVSPYPANRRERRVGWNATAPMRYCFSQAEGSALLAGRVKEAVFILLFRTMERASAVANSISRNNNQDPRVNVLRGRQGRRVTHAASPPGNAALPPR